MRGVHALGRYDNAPGMKGGPKSMFAALWTTCTFASVCGGHHDSADDDDSRMATTMATAAASPSHWQLEVGEESKAVAGIAEAGLGKIATPGASPHAQSRRPGCSTAFPSLSPRRPLPPPPLPPPRPPASYAASVSAAELSTAQQTSTQAPPAAPRPRLSTMSDFLSLSVLQLLSVFSFLTSVLAVLCVGSGSLHRLRVEPAVDAPHPDAMSSITSGKHPLWTWPGLPASFSIDSLIGVGEDDPEEIQGYVGGTELTRMDWQVSRSPRIGAYLPASPPIPHGEVSLTCP